MNKMYYVYLAYLDDVPRYVGFGKRDRYKHVNSGVSSVRELNFHVLKYDKKFRIEFLKTNLSKSDAQKYEIKFIKQYGRLDVGGGTLFNHTFGGVGFRGGHTHISKEKIAKASKNMWDSMSENDKTSRINVFLDNGKNTRYKKGRYSENSCFWKILDPMGNMIIVRGLARYLKKHDMTFLFNRAIEKNRGNPGIMGRGKGWIVEQI